MMNLSLIKIGPSELFIVRAERTIMSMFTIRRLHMAASIPAEFAALVEPSELGVHLTI